MPLSYPLTRAQFFDLLRIESAVTTLPRQPAAELTRPDGGLQRAFRGERLWEGEVQLVREYHPDAAGNEALMSLLLEPGATFLAGDPRYTGPKADPGGVILGSAAPKLHSVTEARRELRLFDLPAGYVLSRGDLLSFAYGSDPTRYALHRIVVGGVTAGDGITPQLEVVPSVRAGFALNAAVNLLTPSCKAIMRQAGMGTAGQIFTAGSGFEWVQVLR
jgi:hypothetical protein